MNDRNRIDDRAIPPLPAKGQSLAAPKTEIISFIIIFSIVMTLALGFLAYSLVKFDQRQQRPTPHNKEKTNEK